MIPVDVPPLRERPGDVEILADHFLSGFGRREGLTADLQRRLRAYGWPGNVRELRNVIERAHILAGAQPVGEEHLMLDVTAMSRRRDAAADPAAG